MSTGRHTIPVTFDKSHIITIGERLYSESIELIREIVNNAYDADATRVDVTISDEKIEVKDDGSGMNMAGLEQYFNIGSPYKLKKQVSPRFGRNRIGQFGIGKFASLAACERFVVETQSGDFAARVTFDKNEWERNPDIWHLPLERQRPCPIRGDGTVVTLENLTKSFSLEDVEERIVEGVPLKAPNFKVYLNGYPVLPRSYSGHRMPILEGTPFGPISGEIVILPASGASLDQAGIECKVRQVTIMRETFGMEMWGMAAARIRGEINADFLPITSDRTGFVRDSDEYRAFAIAMQRVTTEIKRHLNALSDKRENRRAARAFNEALQRVYSAIFRNPDASPFGAIPMGGADSKSIGGAAAVSERHDRSKGENDMDSAVPEGGGDVELKGEAQPEEVELPARLKKKPKAIKKLTPNAMVKKLKFGKDRIACCLDHYGPDKPECFSEGTVIYINRDHPLYRRESRTAATFTMYIARLLTQEITLMNDIRSPRRAFDLQGRLLRDAFLDKG